MIQRLAARFRRLQRNRKLFLGFRLSNNPPQPARTQFQLEILLFVGARGAHQPFRSVVASQRHAQGTHVQEKCSRSRQAAAKQTLRKRKRMRSTVEPCASRLFGAARVTILVLSTTAKANAGTIIDCFDAKSKVTPSCDCGVLFECPIVKGIQASESLP